MTHKVLVAIPDGLEEDQPRSGTWATIRMARRKGILVVVMEPEG